MDQPRQHHHIGCVPRPAGREVDADLPAQLGREADALRRIPRGGRRGIEAMSAAWNRRRLDDGGRLGSIGDGLPRSGAVTLAGLAAAPGRVTGSRAGAGLDPAGPVRMRDLRPVRSGIVRRRTRRGVVPRRPVPENVAERRSLVLRVPPGRRRIRAAVVPSAGGLMP